MKGISRLFSKEVVVPHPESKPLSHYLTPKPKPKLQIKQTTDKLLTEDQVVKQCTEYLRKNGWITKTIYTGGIPLGNGRYATNPAAGIPDSIAFHIGDKRVLFIEYKKSKGGLMSQDQKEWHDLLRHCKQKVLVINSLESLKEALL